MTLIYAGIGARNTPSDVLQTMEQFGQVLGTNGFILRSGAADGADTAFEQGANAVGGFKEIYLPWNGFNGRYDKAIYPKDSQLLQDAMIIAQKHHPAWSSCSWGAKQLHARNSFQVLGATLHQPADFILCWTPGGKGGGGTGQTIRIAKDVGIPVYDLGAMSVSEVQNAINKLHYQKG